MEILIKVKPGQMSFAIGHPEGLLWTFYIWYDKSSKT